MGFSFGGGTSQYFLQGSECGVMQDQRATDCLPCTRYHVRYRSAPDVVSAGLGYTAASDPHHEVYTTQGRCYKGGGIGGHAVDAGGYGGSWSGYDLARHRFYQAWASLPASQGHTWKNGANSFWGNTQQFLQCNDWWAGSNGQVGFYKIPTFYH
jgi:hypothetical protein